MESRSLDQARVFGKYITSRTRTRRHVKAARRSPASASGSLSTGPTSFVCRCMAVLARHRTLEWARRLKAHWGW